MKAGDKIRLAAYRGTTLIDSEDYVVEEFRHCLGIFRSPVDRKTGGFTPLCQLYEPGPESKEEYIPNHGSYYTNKVQGWMDIPKD